MNTRVLAYLQLHTAVLLYGLTAILGDLISLSAMSLVWWRVLITSLSLLGFVGLGRRILRMERRLVLRYIAIGFLVAMHWLSFYGAIKYANASIVLAAMATTSLFTSLVEPLITKRPFRRLELVLGFLVIPPMILIARNIELSMQLGLWVALLSAFLASVFASLNKKYVDKAGPFEISFIEMASAWVFITLLMPVFSQEMGRLLPLPQDWIYLLILSLMCTTFAYVISMKALKHVTAFDANLVINLEPVYGIFLAIFILKEHQELDPRFYYGVVLIMLIVFAHPLIQRKIYGRKKV